MCAQKDKHVGDFHVRERAYGTVSRSVPVPPNVDTSKLHANFDKGALRITLPKREAKHKSVPIS